MNEIIVSMENICKTFPGVKALAKFFRYTITNIENLVTVQDELDNCETYFLIQKYRFDDRLQLHIDYDAEDFNLQIYQGEIMGLVPISAHGLQELLQLMQTNMPLYDGYVYYCGERVNSWKSTRRSVNRIGIIDAHSRLVEHMTVSDNIFVLRQGFRQNVIKGKLLKRQLAPFMRDIEMEIPADVYVNKLPALERVVVELLRAVVAGYRLIVLNEISTVINGEEFGSVSINAPWLDLYR